MILATALVFSFHCLAPLTNANGSTGTDSVTIISRVVALPLPYRFILDDSARVWRGERYPRQYPLAGTAAASDSTRHYWTFVRCDRKGHNAWVRDSLGILSKQWRANYGAYRSLWGTAK